MMGNRTNHARGSANGSAILDTATVLRMRRMYARGMSSPRIAAQVGVSAPAAGAAIFGRHWSHVRNAQVPRDRRDRAPRKLNAAQVVELRTLYAGGAKATDLATRFGIRLTAVYMAVYGQTYSHLGGPLTRRGGREVKLCDRHVVEMRKLYAAGETAQEIAARFGVECSTAALAIRGVTWSHLNHDHPPFPRLRPGRKRKLDASQVLACVEARRKGEKGWAESLAKQFGASTSIIYDYATGRKKAL